MTSVDVFGRPSKKSESILKILSNGGLNLIDGILKIKLDRNTNNILNLSANGLMGNGVKSSGGVMTGNLAMDGNQITGLDVTHPPRNKTQATSWAQVKQLVVDYSNLFWSINGNDAGQNITFGTMDDFDIKFVRNGQEYVIFHPKEVLINKNLNMNNFSLSNLAEPMNPQQPATKNYVDIRKFKNNCGFILCVGTR